MIFDLQDAPPVSEDYNFLTTVSIPVYDRRKSAVSYKPTHLFLHESIKLQASFYFEFKKAILLNDETNILFEKKT